MNAPRFLLGAALLFWGWVTDFLSLGALLAIGLETSRWTRWRWPLSDKEFNRIWDLTALLLVGIAIYSYSREDLVYSVLSFTQLLPLIFFFICAALAYSGRFVLPVSTFLWNLRGRSEGGKEINISYLYFGVCLFSASATKGGHIYFYLGLVALVGWALLVRSRDSMRVFPRGVLLLAIAAAGYLAHTWLKTFQPEFERRSVQWLFSTRQREAQDLAVETAMGRIGELNLSSRLAFRLQPAHSGNPPRLMRQATYNQLFHNSWHALRRDFVGVPPAGEGVWELSSGLGATNVATVAQVLKEGAGALCLPTGSARLQNKEWTRVERGRLGVVRVARSPKAVQYQVVYGDEGASDSPPDKYDQKVPAAEVPAISRIVAELDLKNKTPKEKLTILQDWFRTNFTYTTYLSGKHAPRPPFDTTPLSRFLLRHRSGHCEYFASAAVLILREAGLPARYATGYAVLPDARRGRTWFVRESHGHAWALVYLDGSWRDFDTTPEDRSTQGQAGNLLLGFRDIWANMAFTFYQWQWWFNQWNVVTVLFWGFACLIGALIWRQFWRKRHSASASSADPTSLKRTGADSEFYLIEQKLTEAGFSRSEGETAESWLGRISEKITNTETLRSILQLHYRYRFDPASISAEERKVLREKAAEWLAANAQGVGR